MKKNILNFKLYKIFFLTMLIDPIFVIYAYSCGLSVSEIFILSSIETLLIVLLEIPTGIVADLFGCKISIIWGIISFICSNIIVLLYPKFLGFLICSTLIAFYKVLISGADETYLYLALENKDDYSKISGSLDSIGFILTGIASICVSYIYSINEKYPFFLSILVCLFALIAAMRLENIKENELQIKTVSALYEEFCKIVKRGFMCVFKSNKLKWFMSFSTIVSFLLVSVLQTYQLFFLEQKVPVEYFGLIYFGLYIVSSISSKYAYLFKQFDVYKSFMILLGLLVLTPLVMSFQIPYLIFIIAIPRIVIGIYPVLIREYMNKEIKEDRAMIFSARSLLSRLMQVFLLPVVGNIIDKSSLGHSFVVICALGLAVFFVLLISLHYLNLVDADK